MRVLPLLVAALVALTGSPLAAQPTLRATAVAGGAADAAGDTWRVRGTIGQAVAGRVTRRQFILTQGLWPTPPMAAPGIAVTATPETSPLHVYPGDKFSLVAGFTVPAGGPASFQYWAQATYPNAAPIDVLGPITLMLTPPTTAAVPLLQTVATDAPPGDHVYTLFAGTHPSAVAGQASFRYTVTLPPDGLPSLHASGADRRATARPLDGARLASGAPAGPWLAFDADGRLLLPGDVMDLRADSAVAAKDGPDTMAPEDAQSTASDLPAVVTLGAPHPNPTRTSSTVRFGLPSAGAVRLAIYDALGRRVGDLADGAHEAGWHTASVATDGLASGVYVIRLQAGDQTVTRRLTVVR